MAIYTEHQCPLCRKGIIGIKKERTGQVGIEEHNYSIYRNTCRCVKSVSRIASIAFKSYQNGKLFGQNLCEDCGQNGVALLYPTKKGLSKYKAICASCFEAKIHEIKISQPK
ncbi:hypothetical protein AC622_03270 [Bacillus sp. FJAT-27916]|nr:hypothetical protein AC622_03270 [Bacillus sp. FJAT-27916]